MGRVQWVNSIINGMFFYSFRIYAWPNSLLKLVDRRIKNFICVADLDQQKICIVKWSTICILMEKGRLGLIDVITIYKTTYLKLSWNFLYFDDT